MNEFERHYLEQEKFFTDITLREDIVEFSVKKLKVGLRLYLFTTADGYNHLSLKNKLYDAYAQYRREPIGVFKILKLK